MPFFLLPLPAGEQGERHPHWLSDDQGGIENIQDWLFPGRAVELAGESVQTELPGCLGHPVPEGTNTNFGTNDKSHPGLDGIPSKRDI